MVPFPEAWGHIFGNFGMTGFLGAEWSVGSGSEDVSEVAAALADGGGVMEGSRTLPGRRTTGGGKI